MIIQELKTKLTYEHEKMAVNWVSLVRRTPYMRTAQKFSDQELISRNSRVYQKLGECIDKDFLPSEIGKHYAQIGKERFNEKFPLCEIQYGMIISKKILFEYFLNSHIMETSIQLIEISELLRKITHYFDLGNFYLTRGYLEEMYIKMLDTSGIKKEKLKDYIYEGSFFKDSEISW